MAKIYPVIKKVIQQVSGAAPTGTWAEDAEITDESKPKAKLFDDAEAADSINKITSNLDDDAELGDIWTSNIDAEWDEDTQISDEPKPKARLEDSAQASDEPRPKVRLADDAQIGDEPRPKVKVADDANVNDLSRVQPTDVIIGRSGTPDTDPAGDAWIDQLAANVNTNHGNENLIVKGKSTLANDERRAFVEIDLTWASNFSAQAVANAFSFTFTAFNDNILLTTELNWRIESFTSRPFTESTVTWNAPPGAGTLIEDDGGVGFDVDSTGSFTINLGKSDTNSILGKWILIRFTSPSVAVPDTITIQSRDAGSPQWNYDLKLKRGA